MLKEAKKLIPTITSSDLEFSEKVGIRPQLYNNISRKLLTDFHLETTPCSTHILNAISPAFTASFAFADYVIHNDGTELELKNQIDELYNSLV